MKVLICDYTGNSAQWIDEFIIIENLEVVGTITPATDKKLLAENTWEYLLIFEHGNEKFFMSLAHFMNIPPQRVIFALDWKSWAEHPAAMYTLLNPTRGAVAYRILHFNTARQFNYFTSCTTADGLHYVATSKDDVIITTTYMYGKNHAADEMKIFHALAKKYYSVDDSAGYFLDLGANIGTTGIYFTSKLAPNLKLLAFEPDAENFKLLRVNLILNDLDNKSTVVNCGLGDKFDTMTMYRNLQNPGGNSVISYKDNMPTAQIKIIPLDSYFAENKIPAREVIYIWIDTEGFEAQVLLGAKNLLSENPAPVFMEFNPMMWNKSGRFEEMLALLKAVGYTNYIWIPELLQTGEDRLRPLDELLTWRGSNYWIGDLGDIFLVK